MTGCQRGYTNPPVAAGRKKNEKKLNSKAIHTTY